MTREAPLRPEQLRGAIDAGRTGSKVAFPDPAAAPLGTDEEAAGTPPSDRAVGQAMREVRRPQQSKAEGSEPNFLPGALYVVAGSLAVAAIIGWFMS